MNPPNMSQTRPIENVFGMIWLKKRKIMVGTQKKAKFNKNNQIIFERIRVE